MSKLTSPDKMKLTNTKAILKLIHEENGIYRKLIAERVNLSSQTVTNIVKELLAHKVLKEESIHQNSKGRNPKSLMVNYEGFFVIGVDVTSYAISVVLSDLRGMVLRQETGNIHYKDDACKLLKSLIDRVIADFKCKDKIQAIAVSVQGVVNEKTGVVIEAKSINWNHLDLKRELGYLGIPVLVRNDVNMIAHHEINVYKEDMNFMVVKLDDGVGSSIVIDGHVMRSTNNVAGEFGHITVDHSPHAKTCLCGKKGCLTTIASITAIEKALHLSFEEIKEEVGKGNNQVIGALKDINTVIAPQLANLIILLDLDRIILTGRLINECKDVLYDDLDKLIRKNLSNWVAYRQLELHANENLAIISAKLLMDQFFWNEEENFNMIHKNFLEKE